MNDERIQQEDDAPDEKSSREASLRRWQLCKVFTRASLNRNSLNEREFFKRVSVEKYKMEPAEN